MGRKCPKLTRVVKCNKQPCPVNCKVLKWGKPSACSKSCGGGVSWKTRKVKVRAAHGGKSCPVIKKSTPCNTRKCPISCKLGQFGAWSKCSKACGGGSQSRDRAIKTPAKFGGKPCKKHREERVC